MRNVDFDESIDANQVRKTSIEINIEINSVDNDYELYFKNDDGNSCETPISGTLNYLQPTENPDKNADTTTSEDLDDDQLNFTYDPKFQRCNLHTTEVPPGRLRYEIVCLWPTHCWTWMELGFQRHSSRKQIIRNMKLGESLWKHKWEHWMIRKPSHWFHSQNQKGLWRQNGSMIKIITVRDSSRALKHYL